MTDKIKFSIDGKEYLAEPSESIWDVAKKNNIVTADKKDSQGLCFIGKVKLPIFLQQKLKKK